jgi:hypothetical protein
VEHRGIEPLYIPYAPELLGSAITFLSLVTLAHPAIPLLPVLATVRTAAGALALLLHGTVSSADAIGTVKALISGHHDMFLLVEPCIALPQMGKFKPITRTVRGRTGYSGAERIELSLRSNQLLLRVLSDTRPYY